MTIDYFEVYKQKELCTQEDDPPCTFACPAGVDVRGFLEMIKEDRFESAYKAYQKKVVFPEIISRICSEPCREKCLRSRIDEAIEIRKIEQACTSNAKKKIETYAVRKKDKKVGIIGGGLFGCACALSLGSKGYEIYLYEQNEKLGGQIWNFHEDILPTSVASEEIERLFRDSEIQIRTNCEVTDSLPDSVDVIIIAADLPQNPDGLDSHHIFRAGDWFGEENSYSAIKSVALGLNCAIAAEHFLQGNPYVGKEKPVSKLYVSLKNIETKSKVKSASEDRIYTKEEAAREAGRCIRCQCLECVKSCEFMQHYGRYPKRYINDAQQSLRTLKLLQAKLAARQTNSCNLCGLCKEICPNGVDMSEVYMYSRRIMLNNENLPEAFHRFWLDDMDFAGSEEAFLSRTPAGTDSCDYLFFPGCQMGGSDPAYVHNTYQYLLNSVKGRVGIHIGCCGAPSEWSGYHDKTLEVTDQFKAAWERMEKPTVILTCPSCAKMFQKYHEEIETVTIWELFAQYGIPPEAVNGRNQTLALFDPCSSRYEPKSQQAIRKILKDMEYDVVELAHNKQFAQCCGYGGLTYGANPVLTKEIINSRIKQNPLDFVTYCTNCRDTFVSAGKNTWHILDLIFSDTKRKNQIVHLSQKRTNRKELKMELERKFWGIAAEIHRKNWANIELDINEELRRKLDDDLILVDDMKMAIWHSETSGKRLLLPNGHFMGHLARNIITYWAEYSKTEEGYHLHNGYSHRLKIEE